MQSNELGKMHNELIQKQFDLLFANGIHDSSDSAYKRLPEKLQAKYLEIRSKIQFVQSEMIGKFIN